MRQSSIKTYGDIEALAKLMDDQFELLGFRFGINFIIDLVPEVGDIVSTAIALYIFALTAKYQAPQSVRVKMLINIAIYFVIGLIPFIGDFFQAWWKPNRRNVRLLKKSLA